MTRFFLFCFITLTLSAPAFAGSGAEQDPYLKDRTSHQKKLDENVKRWMTHWEDYKAHRYDPETGLGIQKDWMIKQREEVLEPLKYWEMNQIY